MLKDLFNQLEGMKTGTYKIVKVSQFKFLWCVCTLERTLGFVKLVHIGNYITLTMQSHEDHHDPKSKFKFMYVAWQKQRAVVECRAVGTPNDIKYVTKEEDLFEFDGTLWKQMFAYKLIQLSYVEV